MILNESLFMGEVDIQDDASTLKNTTKLTEVYSSTMPSWLVREIHTNKQVKEALLRRGFDLSNLTFVKIPKDQLPIKSTDPIFKDTTKQLVYLLRDEKRNIVYLPGVGGDSENIEVYLDKSDLTKGTRIKYLSLKQLMEYTVLMGYIENSDANKNTQLRSERTASKQDVISRGQGLHRVEYNEYPKKEDGTTDWENPIKQYRWIMTKGQDKSGYLLNPTKYKDMLDAADMQTYGKQLQRYTNKLEALRTSIIEYMNSLDLSKGKNSDWSTNLSSVMRYFEDALSAFERLLRNIERILSRSDITDERKNREIQAIFDGNSAWSEIVNVRDNITDAWKYLDQLKADDLRRAQRAKTTEDTIAEKLQLNQGAEHIQTLAKRIHDAVIEVSEDLVVSVIETGTGVIIYDGIGNVDFNKVLLIALDELHSDNYEPEVFDNMKVPGGAQCILIDMIHSKSGKKEYNEALHGKEEINKFFDIALKLGYDSLAQMKHLLELGKRAGWGEYETLITAKEVFGDKIPDSMIDGITDEFLELSKDVGMIDEDPSETLKSFEEFVKNEVEPNETYTQAMRRYRQELIDSGADIDALRRRSQQILDKQVGSSKSITEAKQGKYLVQVWNEGAWHDLTRSSSLVKAHTTGLKAVDACYQDYRVLDTSNNDEEVLLEGRMKDIDIAIKNAGGKAAYINQLNNEILMLKNDIAYLDNQGRREIGRGGNYDTIDELEQDISDIQQEIDRLSAILKIVQK